ncbi:hypothetical protein AB6A40_009326 [Gnathostoma spinigerum]|uniref:Uncharacterized protein n=1 Tax=Gnathostoma spinigerum TaxID=75299 RepID=A0ABD6EU30_9BILA
MDNQIVKSVFAIFAIFVVSNCNSEQKCGCIDTEENCSFWSCFGSRWGVCEYTCLRCKRGDGEDGRSGRLDAAMPSVECKDGWTKSVGQDPLFPKQFSGVIKGSPKGKKLFIYSVEGNGIGRFIIQRPGEKSDVPLFLTLRRSSDLELSSKKDGEWCKTSTFDRLMSQQRGNPLVMEVVGSGRSQVYDFSLLDKKTTYRYYPKAVIQAGDYYTLIQDGGAFEGISWTAKSDYAVFSSDLPEG